MDAQSARIALLLALAPALVAVFFVGGNLDYVFPSAWKAGGFRVGATGFTLVLCVTVWLVWRKYIRFTAARASATFALTALVFGQVLVWQPLWNMPGCADNDILRCAQTLTAAGLWIAGCGISWWAAILLRRQSAKRRRVTDDATRRFTVSPNIARLAVGFALIPFLPGLFFMVGMSLDHFLGLEDELDVIIAYEACAIVAVAVWLALWRSAVRWTPGGKTATGALAILILASPFSLYLPDGPEPWEAVCGTIPILALAAWFAGTAWAWSGKLSSAATAGLDETDIDRAARCPKCDYSLRGLREVRCPECGWTSTVDDVIGRGIATLTEP